MDLPNVFYDGLDGPLRVAASVVPVYALVVALVRVMGKRVTSQMNNFDWIVTVAVGSIIASTVLTEATVVLEGMTAVALLFAVQYGVTWLSNRDDRFERVVKSAPAVLVLHGRFCTDALRRERVSRAEVVSAVRESGLASLDDVAAVILESDAQMSVLSRSSVAGVTDDALLIPDDPDRTT